MSENDYPVFAIFYGIGGCGGAMVLSALGASYATARGGTAIATTAVVRPDMIMKSLVPIIMAGILAIYGLVIAVLIGNDIKKDVMKYSLYRGLTHLGAGFSVGLCSIAAGYAIGLVGDYGVRACALQPKLFIGMILMLIFAEVLGLYGLIIAVFLYAN